MDQPQADHLLILWTSADREVALNMVLMYARNSLLQGWWAHVELVLWGPAQRLFLEDAEVGQAVEEVRQAGVRLRACIACAKKYGLVEALKAQGLEVAGMGPVLTQWLKSAGKVVTF